VARATGWTSGGGAPAGAGLPVAPAAGGPGGGRVSPDAGAGPAVPPLRGGETAGPVPLHPGTGPDRPAAVSEDTPKGTLPAGRSRTRENALATNGATLAARPGHGPQGELPRKGGMVRQTWEALLAGPRTVGEA